MIMARNGHYLPRTGHDHELADTAWERVGPLGGGKDIRQADAVLAGATY
jgi:hypothetical protein